MQKNDFVALLKIDIREMTEVFHIFLCSEPKEGYVSKIESLLKI